MRAPEITIKMLREKEACTEAIEDLRKLFPRGRIPVTKATARKLLATGDGGRDLILWALRTWVKDGLWWSDTKFVNPRYDHVTEINPDADFNACPKCLADAYVAVDLLREALAPKPPVVEVLLTEGIRKTACEGGIRFLDAHFPNGIPMTEESLVTLFTHNKHPRTSLGFLTGQLLSEAADEEIDAMGAFDYTTSDKDLFVRKGMRAFELYKEERGK